MKMLTIVHARNQIIMNRLKNLNFYSQSEGLLQILRYMKIKISQTKFNKRCFLMLLYKPEFDVDFDSLQNSNLQNGKALDINSQDSSTNSQDNNFDLTNLCISDKVLEFCSDKNKLDTNSCKVFVNNLPYKVRQRELWDFFDYFGKVLRVTIMKDRKTKRSKGFGFVIFSSPFEAQRAIMGKKCELKLHGRLLNVLKPCKQKRGQPVENPNAVDSQQRLQDATSFFLDSKKDKNQDFCMDCNINQLCNDVILEIFSYLDTKTRVKCELVCKRWQNLSIESWLAIKHLDFKSIFNKTMFMGLTDRILMSILKKGCSNLKSLDLSASPYLLTDHSLSLIGKLCKNLEVLDVSHVPIKNMTLRMLGKNLLKLRKIYLRRCLDVGEKGIWWLVKDLIELQVLYITENSRLVGKCLYMLHSTLEEINLSSCTRLNDAGLQNLASHSENLQYLDLSRCSGFGDPGLLAICEKASNLLHLSLKELGSNVTFWGLEHVEHLQHLTYLDISRNFTVNDSVLQAIANGCSVLTYLNIEGCHGDITCDGVMSLSACEQLKELNISYIMEVCDECVVSLLRIEKLRKLILRSCNGVTNQCAALCINQMDSLCLLDLSDCFYVDDLILDLLEQRFTSKFIELVVGGTKISEECLRKLEERLTPCSISLQKYSQSMLKNNADLTLIPSDEFLSDESDNDEPKNQRTMHVFQDDIDFDMSVEYPNIDEDGEKLWQVEIPIAENLNVISDLQIQEIELEDEKQLNSESDIILDTESESECVEEEDWDQDIGDGLEWQLPEEHVFDNNFCDKDEVDEFLEYDDPSIYELQG